MQMKGVRCERRSARNNDAYELVTGKGNNASDRHNVVSIDRPIQDLKKNRDRWRDIDTSVDEEVCHVHVLGSDHVVRNQPLRRYTNLRQTVVILSVNDKSGV